MNELVLKPLDFERGGFHHVRMPIMMDEGATKAFAWIVGKAAGVIVFSVMEISPVVPGLSGLTTQMIDGRQFMGLDLGRHTSYRVSRYDSEPGPCIFLEGVPCYYEGSGMAAFELLTEAVQRNDEDVIWRALAVYYKLWIEEGGDDDAEEVEGPLDRPGSEGTE